MPNHAKIAEEAAGHFEDDERAIAAIGGSYECKIMGSKSVRNGVFIATTERVFFYAKKMFGAYDSETFPYQGISSIEASKGAIMGHRIKLFASGNEVQMKWIRWGDPETFVSEVRSRMGKKSDAVPAPEAAPDLADQIRKLAELRDEGILTDEEFAAKKGQLLGL